MADKTLFRIEDLEEVTLAPQPVDCLGMHFDSDDARRNYFREELRKKLPQLRDIDGFPNGSDEDILNLSDPPYYTACPNPWLGEINSTGNKIVLTPYAKDFAVDDRHKVYSYHPYHTKVPPTIIKKLIEYYTNEGDVVLDIFCGSGMTGVAAREAHRKAIVTDLSPIATFIAGINTSSFDVRVVTSVMERIIEESESNLGWMYETTKNHRVYAANYFVWSDVFTCPECCKEFPIFPYGVIHHGNKVETLKEFKCPHCGLSLNVRKINRVIEGNRKKSIPVWVNAGSGRNRVNTEVDQADLDIIHKVQVYSHKHNTAWFPEDVIDPNRYSAKLAQLGQKHISDISRFLSERNLMIYADLWDRICKIKDISIRNACKSMLTSIFTVISERQGYFGGGGGMSGNLYMPIVRMEKNIYDTLRRKIKKFTDSELSKPKDQIDHYVTTQSSTSLPNINSNSVDFIFTDPPFGANIMYSEMNLLLEGWLKVKTNNTDEAVIDESGNKSFIDYENLLTNCFKECYRVLKPGHWMCVEFHNTQASIWNILQNAINSAGFVIAQVSKLDKGSTTILADIRPGAVVQDLIIACYKRTADNNTDFYGDVKKTTWEFIDEHLSRLPIAIQSESSLTPNVERSPRILFDRLVAFFLQKNIPLTINMSEFIVGLDARYIKRDGVYFSASHAMEYERLKSGSQSFVPMALFISNEAEGIEWLKIRLQQPKSYKEIHPEWIKDLSSSKKGDKVPELIEILEENFIKDEDEKWHIPDLEDSVQLEAIKTKRMLKEFNIYLEQAKLPKSGRIANTRLEVLRFGFKECNKAKNYKDIVLVGDHIEETLLMEDEQLLMYYLKASKRV